jgi:hypothetical protein
MACAEQDGCGRCRWKEPDRARLSKGDGPGYERLRKLTRNEPHRRRRILELRKQRHLSLPARAVAPPHGDPVRCVGPGMAGDAEEGNARGKRIVGPVGEVQILRYRAAARGAGRAAKGQQDRAVGTPLSAVIGAVFRPDRHLWSEVTRISFSATDREVARCSPPGTADPPEIPLY